MKKSLSDNRQVLIACCGLSTPADFASRDLRQREQFMAWLRDAADLMTQDGETIAQLLAALEKLARLGNGDRYGNSDGNMIARAAIARATGEQA